MRSSLRVLIMKVSDCGLSDNIRPFRACISNPLILAPDVANVGPWVRLAKTLGLTLKYWLPTAQDPNNPFSLHLDPTELEPLITGHTRLVAFTAKSNLLGHGTDVKAVVDLVKRKTGGRGMTVIDCVAACPHVVMDMKAWGCDAVMFSHYKVSTPACPPPTQ